MKLFIKLELENNNKTYVGYSPDKMTVSDLFKVLLAREWAMALHCLGTYWTTRDCKSLLLFWIFEIVHHISFLLLILLLTRSATSL